eukprot:3933930-Rhodomonas_salina.1
MSDKVTQCRTMSGRSLSLNAETLRWHCFAGWNRQACRGASNAPNAQLDFSSNKTLGSLSSSAARWPSRAAAR